MERLPLHIDATASANVRGPPGKFQRWVRTAVLGTLPFLCGGDASPPHHRHQDTADNYAVQKEPPPRTDGLPGTFYEERTKDLDLTEEHYIDLLAQSLTTPEKLNQFLNSRMRYAWDSPDPDNPLQEGTEDTH